MLVRNGSVNRVHGLLLMFNSCDCFMSLLEALKILVKFIATEHKKLQVTARVAGHHSARFEDEFMAR